MYDKIYTYNDQSKEEQKNEKIEFGFKDILAMTIAAYQVVFVPMAILALAMIIIYLLFSILA